MLFVEPRFLFFFVVVFGLHWCLRTQTSRKFVLLAASYVFYAAWDWRFLSLILASTLIDYFVGICLARERGQARRKLWLVVSVVGNLGILGFFKYFNFFVESAVGLSQWIGLPVSFDTLRIILPVGISFYTFQTLSYSIDVYHRRLPATRSLLDLALFVGFFPQLVAGPIVRALDFLPQLRDKKFLGNVAFRSCLTLFLFGLFKKTFISDNLAPTVDAYFATPEDYSVATCWLAVFFYAVQIYCDFSGYSDMAIACAQLLGYQLCTNFHFPYFAADITDFWRRWHMSLSSWLRDYLYIPLGGSRGSRLFNYRNLMITMLLGGLWHGAAWNFIVWGALHGLALIVHKEWQRATGGAMRFPPVLGCAITFYWVCLAWVFFRAADLTTASTILKSFLLFESQGAATIGLEKWWIIPSIILVHWLTYGDRLLEQIQRLPRWSFAAGYSFLAVLTLTLMPSSYHPFIYFQF